MKIDLMKALALGLAVMLMMAVPFAFGAVDNYLSNDKCVKDPNMGDCKCDGAQSSSGGSGTADDSGTSSGGVPSMLPGDSHSGTGDNQIKCIRAPCPSSPSSGSGGTHISTRSSGGIQGGAGVGCAWVKINGGPLRPGNSLQSALFRMGENAISPALFTPQSLNFVAGYAMKGVSHEVTSDGAPQQVTMVQSGGVPFAFRFADGESIGVPVFGDDWVRKLRLFMVDANGWAILKDPAYYDLYTGDGEMYRFNACKTSSAYMQLVLHRTVAGREETYQDFGVEVIRDSGQSLRQVLLPSRLVDIVVEDDCHYSVKLYALADLEVGKGTNGCYRLKAQATPFEAWSIGNPEPGTLRKLRVTRVTGSRTTVYDYAYSADANTWTLAMGDGNTVLRQQAEVSAWNDSRTERQITRYNVGNGLQSDRVTERVRTFSWGDGVTQRVTDPGGANLTETFTYNAAGWTESVVNPDGSWRWYRYDAAGRTTNEISAFKDSALTSNVNAAHAIITDYAPVDPADSPRLNDQAPRTITERVMGTVVKKNYRAFRLGSNRELQDVVEVCPDPSAAYGDSRNIRMVTTFYGTNTVNYQIGRVKTVVYPNGRMDTRTYEYGTFVPAAGQTPPYFVSDPSGKHWCETVVHGTTNHPEGMAGRTIRETAVRDPMNQVVLAETWVYTGEGNYDRLAWETQSYDEWLHPVLVINSSGEKSEASWGGNCCGKLWERGPNGMEYEYVYDAIGSVVYRIKKGATTNAPDLYSSYTYDGAGRRLTETLLSGGLSLLVSSNTYDNAGRLAASVDAQGIVTAYAYNGLSNSTMRGGLTNTTVRYLSGSTKFTAENGATKTTYDYGVNADGSQWSKFFNGPDGLNSPVWQKTTVDSLGRGILVENPGFGGVAVVSTSCYNHQNQLVKTSRTSAPDTLYSYNEIAEQFRSGLDVNTNGVLDLAGPDRVSESAAWFEKDGAGNDWGCRASLLYAGNGSAVPITNGIQRLRLMGNEMPSNGLISEMIAADMLGNQTTSRTYVDRNAKTVIQVVTYPDSTNNSSQITINGQLASSTSKTGVRTDFSYDGLGRQVSAINHQPSTIRSVGSFTHYNAKGQVDWTMDAASNVTSFAYDSLGRRVAVTDALSNTVYTAYDADGRVTNTWGATYPVAYRYDDYGRMALMKTFRSEGGAGDETRWLYDEATGLLTNKLYADGKGTAYSYTPDGKLARRTWARGVATTYNYDSLNQLTNISYSDSTPTVGFTYDRLGRQITITDGTGTRAFAYNDALQLAAETNALGVLQYAFDGLGRPAGFDAGPGYSVRYAYDPLGRFSAVTSSVASASSVAGYSYLPGSDLVAGHANSDGFSVTRSYEPNRNLITQILNTSGTNVISRFGYVNDAVGRRTLRVDSASLTNAFGYNARSELVNASMGTNTYGYAYDPIGNRRTATNNAEALCYAANALNQYTNISNGAVITPQYDSDGNMTNYGAFAFAWDGENRLVGVSSNGQAVASFAYDFMSRRYQKVAGSTTNAFLYDGWAMISETIRNSSFAMTNSYVYGLDLSGTLQGAGTIGGILDMSLAGTNVVCAYDANGNLTDLVGAYGGAHYEYDPYGNTIAKTGVLADANPFRFSTKYLDDESSLYYYGYRYYQPESGRWLSRDPIQERGGRNLYAFALNAPGNYVDTYGETILGPTPSAADIMKFLSLLNDAKKCVEGMLAANKAATDWFKVIDDTYVCCGKKKAIAKVSDFPGADTGDFGSTHGVLHCALGVEARDHGVGDDCINTFNVLWEMWEFMSPKYWEWMPDWVPVFGSKGPEAWIKDTKSDMAAVIGGYKDKVKKEDCIPSSCHPKK